MGSFSSLRSKKSLLNKLAAEAKKDQKGGPDERFWKLTVDAKSKIGYAEIRFLPAPADEDIPWARVYNHGFQINGSWFIENCPTTLSRDHACPVCKDNNRLWATGIEADKDVARNRKRKLSFISNILVVNDPAHPENNGKVFLFRYGKKIQDKIMELIEPQFPDQKPADPFYPLKYNEQDKNVGGSNFKLKSASVGGFQNYDKSSFDAPSDIPGDEKAIDAILNQCRSLREFTDPKQFKSYEDLENRFNKVLTGQGGSAKTAEDAIKKGRATAEDAEEVAEAVEQEERKAAYKSTRKKASPKPEPEPETDDTDEGGSDVAPEDVDDIKKFFGDVED